MVVMQPLRVLVENQCLRSEITHKAPTANMKATAILRHRFICKPHKLGIGMIRMTKSCVMANALFANPMAPTSRHFPLTSLSQKDWIGVHANIVKNWIMIVDKVMKPMTNQHTMRKRWSSKTWR